MAKNASIITCALLLVYFVFTSGIAFEVLHSNVVGAIDLPYSVAFSGERLNMVGIFNEDDVACASWLVDNRGGVSLDADYNSLRLLMGCMRDLENFVAKTDGERYLFLSSWNIRHQVMVVGLRPALRAYVPLPSVDDAVVVFQRGEAIVYYIRGDAE